MADQELKTVNFKTQMRDERRLFLRRLKDGDKVPGSDVTLGEAKENWAKVDAEFQKKKFERSQKVLSEKPQTIQTSMVVPGILVNVEMPKPQPVLTGAMERRLVGDDGLLPLPSDEVLDGMEVAELITLAGNRKVEVKANVDSKPTLIKKLKGVYVSKEDAATASLSGKSRADHEEIASVLGVKDFDNKESFPTIESLAAAIDAERAKLTPAKETSKEAEKEPSKETDKPK